jgi:xylulokinase
VPPGSNGVFFLPYLSGERTPHADPDARGCFVGISNSTSKAELTRAVIEGATFAMGDVVDLIKASGIKSRQIRLSGGGARSRFWRQLQADVYGSTCATINSEEGGALGGALLAAVGTGEYSNIRQACNECIKVTREIKPDAKSKRIYRALHDQYDRLYPALKGEFKKMAGL